MEQLFNYTLLVLRLLSFCLPKYSCLTRVKRLKVPPNIADPISIKDSGISLKRDGENFGGHLHCGHLKHIFTAPWLIKSVGNNHFFSNTMWKFYEIKNGRFLFISFLDDGHFTWKSMAISPINLRVLCNIDKDLKYVVLLFLASDFNAN